MRVNVENFDSRVHICRNRCNRRLRKISVDCVNFSVNNAKKIGSCQINDDNVSIVHFHVLM